MHFVSVSLGRLQVVTPLWANDTPSVKTSAANASDSDICGATARSEEWLMAAPSALWPPAPPPLPVPPSISGALFSCFPNVGAGHKLISIVSWQVPQCHVFIERFLQRLPRVKASPRRGVNCRPLADDTEQKGNHRENNEASCNALKWESLLNLSVFCLL